MKTDSYKLHSLSMYEITCASSVWLWSSWFITSGDSLVRLSIAVSWLLQSVAFGLCSRLALWDSRISVVMVEWRECFMIAFAFFNAPDENFLSPSLTTSCKGWQAHLICSRSVVGSSLLSAWSSSSSWSVSSTSPKSMDGSEKALITLAFTLPPICWLPHHT